MRNAIVALVIVSLVACAKQEASKTPSPTPRSPSATTSSAAEKTYPMTATIISRDAAKNTLNLDNKAVPGKMAAMKMSYEVRGAKVTSLPADGTSIVVTVHDQNGSYYITDVKAKR